MESQKIKLVNSTYPVEEAREVMLSLINDKIKFLRQKQFSEYIRFGLDQDHMKQRVEELFEDKQALQDMCTSAEGAGLEARIVCDLKVEWVPCKDLQLS